jgi:hypothetical protein
MRALEAAMQTSTICWPRQGANIAKCIDLCNRPPTIFDFTAYFPLSSIFKKKGVLFTPSKNEYVVKK